MVLRNALTCSFWLTPTGSQKTPLASCIFSGKLLSCPGPQVSPCMTPEVWVTIFWDSFSSKMTHWLLVHWSPCLPWHRMTLALNGRGGNTCAPACIPKGPEEEPLLVADAWSWQGWRGTRVGGMLILGKELSGFLPIGQWVMSTRRHQIHSISVNTAFGAIQSSWAQVSKLQDNYGIHKYWNLFPILNALWPIFPHLSLIPGF